MYEYMRTFIFHTHTHTQRCVSLNSISSSHPGLLLGVVALSLSFQQAKKGLLTLTVRTRLTAPPSLCSHLSPPLCRSLSSSTCITKDSSSFALESPSAPISTAKPNYRIMVEVSLQKGRSAAAASRAWVSQHWLSLPGFPHLESVQRQGRMLSFSTFYSCCLEPGRVFCL